MSWLLTLAVLSGAGLALLALLGLRTGHRAVDGALAWLVGAGWLAAVAPAARFALGLRLGPAAVLVLALAPAAAWAALRAWRRRRPVAAPPEGAAAPAPSTARWIPRPLPLFAPVAAYVAVVVIAVLLHGANTPTYTDDGVRVRAFAPMLAFADGWPPEARAVLSIAAPLPTFVPAFAWIVTGSLDHFHVNYAVLTELLALLVLVVSLASARGSPERGWAGALALLSIPLFVYHCTSTYSDAVLAMRIAGGLLFALEYARGEDPGDAARALLLLGIATLVKREGLLVAAAPAGLLLAHLAWRRRSGAALPWKALPLLAAPAVIASIGMIGATGLASAFPMVGLVAGKATGAVVDGAGPPAGLAAYAASFFFREALFTSGNQGMTFWLLAAVAAARAPAIVRGPLLWPLLSVLALLGEVAVSSIWLVPEYTADQGTVNRALLVASVPAALWLAAAVVDAAREAPAAAPQKAAREAPRRGRVRARAR